MKDLKQLSRLVLLILLLPGVTGPVSRAWAQSVTTGGELRKWHKVTLTFEGPTVAEDSEPNPFTDYRLNVTFTHESGSPTYVVPGYFAADGDAANTSATDGSRWRVHFAPDKTGTWNYQTSFRTGNNVAIDLSADAGSSAGFMDGTTGSLSVAATNKSGRDFRARGRAEYVGQHYLQLQEKGEWFIKAGADAPENMLAYDDFDATPNNGNRRKSWQPHQRDYSAADAANFTWDDGKGTELLGVVRYLGEIKGVNAMSFLTFSLDGDDDNVYPHLQNTGSDSWNQVHHTRFDVSKMDQWERIFEYADQKGVFLHFKTHETENDQLMSDFEGKVYYRELIARYAHHLALVWNISEEISISESQIKDWLSFIEDTDPYRHPTGFHTFPNQQDRYDNFTGNQSDMTYASIQTGKGAVHRDVAAQVNASREANKRWIVCNDEQGSAQVGVDCDPNDRELVREEVLWGALMAGGMGVEYYYGYQTCESDLTAQDHRTRDQKYTDAAIAIRFFQQYFQPYLPDIRPDDGATADNDDYVLRNADRTAYAIYLPGGGSTSLNLGGQSGDYTVRWFDPRNGGDLQNGSVTTISGGSSSSIGNPPGSPSSDWVALVTAGASSPPPPPTGNGAVTLTPADDAYLDNGNRFNTGDLRVEPGRRVSYLKFDVSGVDGNVTNATLRLREGTDPGSGTLRVAVGSSNDWTENNLSDTNKPTAGSTVATRSGSVEDGTLVSFDVTSAVAGNGTLSFVVTMEEGGNDVALQSKEATAAPELVIEYSEEDGGSSSDEPSGEESCGYEEQGGIVVMETENTPTDPGEWINQTDVAGFTGGSHLEFTGNGSNGGPASSPLRYTFKVNKAGAYRLLIRAHKQLDGQPNDKNNDGYVRMEGDFSAVSGDNNAALVDLQKDTKLFGGSANGWAWARKLDVNNKIKKDPIYNFKAGNTYTLVVSGRSVKWNIDRIVLFHSSVAEAQATDINRDETTGGCGTPGGGGPTTPGAVILTPIHDAYWQNGKGYNDPLLRVEKDRRTTYLQFQLPAPEDQVQSVRLTMNVVSDPGSGTFVVSQGTPSRWQETTINESNRPLLGEPLGELSGTFSVGETKVWELDPSIIISDEGLINLLITQISGNDAAFASKEYGQNLQPQLTVVYQDGTVVEGQRQRATTTQGRTLIAYPNPTSDYVTVEGAKAQHDSVIQVFDITGNEVLKTTHQETVDLRQLSPGTYVIRAEGESISVIKE